MSVVTASDCYGTVQAAVRKARRELCEPAGIFADVYRARRSVTYLTPRFR
jgi:hypothetical protein